MWGGKDTALPIQNLGVKRGLNGQRHAPGALPPRKWSGRARLKRDGTRAEARFGLTAKRTSPFKLAGGWGGGQFSRLLAAEVCTSAVVMVVPLACFPFTSPTVRHRVPSGFN